MPFVVVLYNHREGERNPDQHKKLASKKMRKGFKIMKDVQDFKSYIEAKEYAESMRYENGYKIEPFSEGFTVFEL